jgi:hypothetical protein
MSAEQAVELPQNVDQLVDQYVRLRDKLKEADDAHKKKTEQARAYLLTLNGKLLEQLAAVGGESVKTPHGTAYQSTKRSASIADGDAFREYVINNGEFDLVDWRANANAVDDFIKEHGAVPPGVNFSTMITVGVRRA